MPYQLPHGTPYPAALLREKAQQAALHRREMKVRTKKGAHTFCELLTLCEDDHILRRTLVKAALSWLPAIGAAKVKRILADTGVPPTERLGSLTARQQEALLGHPYIVHRTSAVQFQRRSNGAV